MAPNIIIPNTIRHQDSYQRSRQTTFDNHPSQHVLSVESELEFSLHKIASHFWSTNWQSGQNCDSKEEYYFRDIGRLYKELFLSLDKL